MNAPSDLFILYHDSLPTIFSVRDSLCYEYEKRQPAPTLLARPKAKRSCTFFATCFMAKVGLGLGAAAFLCDRDKVLPVSVIVFCTCLPILGFAAVTDIVQWALFS